MATAAAFSSRVCIASYEKHDWQTLKLSAADLMTCCDNCKEGGKSNNGCDGGYVDEAWIFISQHGLVSGGNHGSQDVSPLCYNSTVEERVLRGAFKKDSH